MLKRMIFKIFRSFIKIILPFLYKLLVNLKLNKRVINYLSEKSYFSNNSHDLSPIIENLIGNDKVIAMDVGAQGGFNSDNFFPNRYNRFFEDILIEPIQLEAEKLKNKKYIINKGLWSSKCIKKLYILKNRLGSSSMYEPDRKNFDLHNIKKKDYENFKVTETINVECDTIQSLLAELNVEKLDYLKIDTQGSEFEILKGLGNYRPLLIKVEAHIHSMYKEVPGWHKILNFLCELNYVTIDWKTIGSHNTRTPAEMDMIFIPNFNNPEGERTINNSKDKFISLMLIFGQLNLLKIIMKRLKLENKKLENLEDLYFN